MFCRGALGTDAEILEAIASRAIDLLVSRSRRETFDALRWGVAR